MNTTDLVFVAGFFALLNIVITAFLNKYNSNHIEELRGEITKLNTKSTFKFSKLHEIRLDILKVLSKDLWSVEWEFTAIKTGNKFHSQEIEVSMTNLTNNFWPNAIFFNEEFQTTVAYFIDNVNDFITRIQNNNFPTNTELGEEDESILQIKADTDIMETNLFYHLKEELEKEVRKILNEDDN